MICYGEFGRLNDASDCIILFEDDPYRCLWVMEVEFCLFAEFREEIKDWLLELCN